MGWNRGESRFGARTREATWLACALLCAASCSKKSNPDLSGASGSSASSAGASGGSAGVPSSPAAAGSLASATGGKGTATGSGGSSASDSGSGASGTKASAGASGMQSAGAGGGAAGAAGAAGSTSAAGGCTRDYLKTTIDAFYAAMAAHDPSKLTLGAMTKYTENGTMMMVGDGLWKTAGMVKFKRSALDTTTCNSVTESVMPEGTTDRIFGLRLKSVDQKVTEIETIVVRQGDYILNNPMGLVGTAKDDWETELPADQQATRDKLQMLMEVYITRFPSGACNFASDCTRVEDGGSVGPCTGSGITCSMDSVGTGMKARLYVLDVEAGITVGFWMFAGADTDFHMFKVRMGQVHGAHAILAKAASSGW